MCSAILSFVQIRSFKKKGFSNKKLKFTEEFYNNMISFPFHIWMSDKEFKYLKAL